MSRLHLLDLPADRLEGEAIAAFFFEDQRPLQGPAALLDWRLNGLVSDLVAAGTLHGLPGERLLTNNNGKLCGTWIFFAGAGRWNDLNEESYRLRIGEIISDCRRAGFNRFGLALSALPGQGSGTVESMVRELLNELAPDAECLLSIEGQVSGRGMSRQR